MQTIFYIVGVFVFLFTIPMLIDISKTLHIILENFEESISNKKG